MGEMWRNEADKDVSGFRLSEFFRVILMKFSFTKIQLLIDRVVSSIYMNEILQALASVIILSFFV